MEQRFKKSGSGIDLRIHCRMRQLYILITVCILDMDLGGARQLTDLIIAGTAEDLVNKGGLTEMVLGWELVKYNNPRSQHDLYYWENTADGTRSEVD